MEYKKFTSLKKGKLSLIIFDNIDNFSYSAFMKALRSKDIKVNGKRLNKDSDVNVGDVVEVFYRKSDAELYKIIYENSDVAVIYKKSGYTSESVFECLKSKYKDIRFIHRLDRNTSGIMIFALNGEAESELISGFKLRKFEKYYLAEVVGCPCDKKALNTAYLNKDEKNSLVKIYSHPTKGAVEIKTGYEVLSSKGERSLLKVTLYTGRTHQIRAHLAFSGYPIVGDGKYGDYNKQKDLKRKSQALSAVELILHFDSNCRLSYLDGKSFNIFGIGCFDYKTAKQKYDDGNYDDIFI